MKFRSIHSCLRVAWVIPFLIHGLFPLKGWALGGSVKAIDWEEETRSPYVEVLTNLSKFPQSPSYTYPLYLFENANHPVDYQKWRESQILTLLNPDTQFEIPPGQVQIISEKGREQWVQLEKEGVQIRIQRVPVTQLLWFLVTGTNPSQHSEWWDCWDQYIEIQHWEHSSTRSTKWSNGRRIFYSSTPENWGITGLCPLNPVENVSPSDLVAFQDQLKPLYPFLVGLHKAESEADFRLVIDVSPTPPDPDSELREWMRNMPPMPKVEWQPYEPVESDYLTD